MSGLTLSHVSKQFSESDKVVLNDVNLHVDSNEFLVLLGPSGCGKTTLLRIISGLTEPTEGKILIDDIDVTEMEPQNRGVGMVFQNYALFPHMSIQKNLNFPLDIAKTPKEERDSIVDSIGETLGLHHYFKKRPEQLSGGERQRVAMGRAMVKESRIYLFDEPLSNLDDALRTKLRPEILKSFHELQVPFVYVTHDQVDAMTMATKVAVMKDGVIQQLGTPMEIYDSPINVFVAGFVGSPKMNFIPVTVARTEAGFVLEAGTWNVTLPSDGANLLPYVGSKVLLGIRPEDILTSGETQDAANATVLLKEYEHLGNKIQLYAELDGNRLCITAPVTVRAKVGEKLTVYLDKNKFHLFDEATGRRIQPAGEFR